MTDNHDLSRPRPLRLVKATNLQRAEAGWGGDMPKWVRLLATACDLTSQNKVAHRLGKSSGYISRVVNNNYPGDMAEAESIVRAAYGNERLICPVWGQTIPLQSCMSNRRRVLPPQNHAQRQYARTCPFCPNNPDRIDLDAECGDEED